MDPEGLASDVPTPPPSGPDRTVALLEGDERIRDLSEAKDPTGA